MHWIITVRKYLGQSSLKEISSSPLPRRRKKISLKCQTTSQSTLSTSRATTNKSTWSTESNFDRASSLMPSKNKDKSILSTQLFLSHSPIWRWQQINQVSHSFMAKETTPFKIITKQGDKWPLTHNRWINYMLQFFHSNILCNRMCTKRWTSTFKTRMQRF